MGNNIPKKKRAFLSFPLLCICCQLGVVMDLRQLQTAARCSNDTTLSHETVYFLEAALVLRDVVSDRRRIG